MAAADCQPQMTTLADELDKLGQKFVQDLAQGKRTQEQVRAPFDYMREMQRPCVELLAGMKEAITNVPKEAQQFFIECVRDFDKLLKETMNHCVALKDVVDEQTSAIDNMRKLRRLAKEHGQAVAGNPQFGTFAEKARNNVVSSSHKTDVTRPVTERLITQYVALGHRIAASQKLLVDRACPCWTVLYQKMKLIFDWVASVLASICPCVRGRVAAGSAGAAAISTAEAGAIAGLGGGATAEASAIALSGGTIACMAVASTAGATALGCSAGAGMATDYQETAADIEDKLNGFEDVFIISAKVLDILNVKCGNAQNAGHHVDGSLPGSDDRLDLNVVLANLLGDNDMMDSLDKCRVSIQELRRSIDNLEQESAKNYMKMVAF